MSNLSAARSMLGAAAGCWRGQNHPRRRGPIPAAAPAPASPMMCDAGTAAGKSWAHAHNCSAFSSSIHPLSALPPAAILSVEVPSVRNRPITQTRLQVDVGGEARLRRRAIGWFSGAAHSWLMRMFRGMRNKLLPCAYACAFLTSDDEEAASKQGPHELHV